MLIPVDQNGFWASRGNPVASLQRTATLFNQIDGQTIIEVGSGLHGEQSGNSILVWAGQTRAARIVAIDTEQQRIDEVLEGTKEYENIETHLGDGIQYLKDFTSTIELLYLDFWAGDAPGDFPGTGRADAYREAYMAARGKLSRESLILIDDTDHLDPWKQTLVVLEARKDGFRVLHVGRQTLLMRKAT